MHTCECSARGVSPSVVLCTRHDCTVSYTILVSPCVNTKMTEIDHYLWPISNVSAVGLMHALARLYTAKLMRIISSKTDPVQLKFSPF